MLTFAGIHGALTEQVYWMSVFPNMPKALKKILITTGNKSFQLIRTKDDSIMDSDESNPIFRVGMSNSGDSRKHINAVIS